MEDLAYFVKAFVKKERQQRLLDFAQRRWAKLLDELDHLERHLNERCVLVEKNAFEAAAKVIAEKGVTRGIYIDRLNQAVPAVPAELNGVVDSGLLICRPKQVAFYFHHHGWVWVCQET